MCFQLFSLFQMPLCHDVNTQSVFMFSKYYTFVSSCFQLFIFYLAANTVCVFVFSKYCICVANTICVFKIFLVYMYLCFQCILFFLAALVSWRKYYCRSTRLRPSSQSSINHKCNKSVTFFCIWVSKQSQIFLLLVLLYEGSFAF